MKALAKNVDVGEMEKVLKVNAFPSRPCTTIITSCNSTTSATRCSTIYLSRGSNGYE